MNRFLCERNFSFLWDERPRVQLAVFSCGFSHVSLFPSPDSPGQDMSILVTQTAPGIVPRVGASSFQTSPPTLESPSLLKLQLLGPSSSSLETCLAGVEIQGEGCYGGSIWPEGRET